MTRRSTATPFPSRKPPRPKAEPPPCSLYLIRTYGVLGENLALTERELLDIAAAAGLEPERTLGNGTPLWNPRKLRDAAFVLGGCSRGHREKPMGSLTRIADGQLSTCASCLNSRPNKAARQAATATSITSAIPGTVP